MRDKLRRLLGKGAAPETAPDEPVGTTIAASVASDEQGAKVETPPARERPTLDGPIRITRNQLAKLQLLAKLRHEPFEETVTATIRNLMSVVPASMRADNLITGMPVASIELIDGLVRVTLDNGRILWGFPSRLRYQNLYYTFRDLLPKMVSAETYGPYHDVKFRYLRGTQVRYVPQTPGAVVIEAGAYVGWKALGFYDRMGPGGKVIAIEIGAQQFELLRRNVEANGLEGKIIPLHCGVWTEKGEMEAEYEIYASYSLLPPDEHSHYTRREKVPTDTLDNIIEAQGLEVVDYLNVQVNGAEGMALRGLVRNFDRVKVIYVGAHYHIDGVAQDKAMVDYLQSRGCKILRKVAGSIAAATPRWADQYEVRSAPAPEADDSDEEIEADG